MSRCDNTSLLFSNSWHSQLLPWCRGGAQVNRVVVNVPATTANLGPGFDSFGFALDVWNRVTVERADKFSLTVQGEGEDTIDTSEKNIVVRNGTYFFPSGPIVCATMLSSTKLIPPSAT